MRFGYFDGVMAVIFCVIFVCSSINVERQLALRRKLRAEDVRIPLLDRWDVFQISVSTFTMVVCAVAAIFCAIRFAWSMG